DRRAEADVETHAEAEAGPAVSGRLGEVRRSHRHEDAAELRPRRDQAAVAGGARRGDVVVKRVVVVHRGRESADLVVAEARALGESLADGGERGRRFLHRAHVRSTSARRAASQTKIPAPAAWSARRHAGLARQRRSGATRTTKAIMKSAPWTTNQAPRKRNETSLAGAPPSMNCGSRARKKIAIFGLRTLVRRPWRNRRPRLAARSRAGAAPSPPRPTASPAGTLADAAARSMPIASHTR